MQNLEHLGILSSSTFDYCVGLLRALDLLFLDDLGNNAFHDLFLSNSYARRISKMGQQYL